MEKLFDKNEVIDSESTSIIMVKDVMIRDMIYISWKYAII